MTIVKRGIYLDNHGVKEDSYLFTEGFSLTVCIAPKILGNLCQGHFIYTKV